MQLKDSLLKPQNIHILGIGGAGMSSIAIVLSEMGHRVSGSDLVDSPLLSHLEGVGIKIFVGHKAENLSNLDWEINLVLHSSAVKIAEIDKSPGSNPELEYIKSQNIPIYSRAEILASICGLKKVIAIAGAHGKTTTAAMLAKVLDQASYIIGGQLVETGVGAKWNPKSDWLIVEADESDGTFLKLPRDVAVITSMDPDHIEHYGSEDALVESYFCFAGEASEVVICNAEDRRLNELAADLSAKSKNIITFGEPEEADYVIKNIKNTKTASVAELWNSGKKITIDVPIPGAHNIANATATYLVARQLGFQSKEILKALLEFKGVSRRFQIKGEVGGITFIDDYAHTPLEISKTLETLKNTAEFNTGRIICAFQPHRYSRTRTLWKSYRDAFKHCDFLAVSDIYPAGEDIGATSEEKKVSGKLILNAVLNTEPRKLTAWIPAKEDLVDYLLPRLQPGDIFITLNAGDLFLVGEEIMTRKSRE